MISHVNDLTVCVFVHPDGDVSVDSLSPAHTLSSVPSPASVEVLSPSSLNVRTRPQSFTLSGFLHLNSEFQCKLPCLCFGCEHLHMYPSLNPVRIKTILYLQMGI